MGKRVKVGQGRGGSKNLLRINAKLVGGLGGFRDLALSYLFQILSHTNSLFYF